MQLLSALPSQSPLSFRKWKFLAPSLKKLLFLGEPLGFFITISSGAFISPLIFTIVSGCFHFTNFRVFHHCFCRYFYFTTDFYYCFLSVFISSILFTITVFLSGTLYFLSCCTLISTNLNKLFLLSEIFYLTLYPDI